MEEQPTTGSSPGRPSLAADRRRQVLDAFIELVADSGLEGMTLDDVAARAGVQRSVIRHYVGNRADLVQAAITELTARYTASVRRAVGSEPTSTEIVDFLFGDTWTRTMTTEDQALAVLFQEATRHAGTRRLLRAAYQELLDEVAAAITRDTGIPPAKAATAAYQIVCLAEQNVDMQTLGFDPHYATDTRRLAHQIVDRL
jgi:AcrR family transcriptional regulator